jgi:hypothetical protein
VTLQRGRKIPNTNAHDAINFGDPKSNIIHIGCACHVKGHHWKSQALVNCCNCHEKKFLVHLKCIWHKEYPSKKTLDYLGSVFLFHVPSFSMRSHLSWISKELPFGNSSLNKHLGEIVQKVSWASNLRNFPYLT